MFEKIKTNNVLCNSLGSLPATTAVLSNNQIGRYISSEGATILKNVFSATANGFGKVFYQPNEFTILQDSYSFEFKNKELKIEKIHSFIVSTLNKVYSKYNWGNKSGWNKVKEEKIQLPITDTGEIDYAFMEAFIAELEAERIAELEAERIAELEAYLSATGLKDTTLTPQEQQVLNDLDNDNIEWGEFSYKSIFNKIIQGRRLKKDDQVPGNIPFVMAGTTNTGVVNYISNPVASFPKNSITVDIFGNTFYRNYDFGAGDDTGVYWNDKKEYSKKIMLFFASSMEKSMQDKFSYGKKLRSSQSLNFEIQLPITDTGQIDYAFMEILITAVQKQVIQGVGAYADRKIAATRGLVNKENG